MRWIVLALILGGCGPESAGMGDKGAGQTDTSATMSDGSTGDTLGPAGSSGDDDPCEDAGGDCACPIRPIGGVVWTWDFGAWYAESVGSPAPTPRLTCVGQLEVRGTGIVLPLTCETVDETNLVMETTVDPAPAILLAKAASNPNVKVHYQPELRCPNGCFLEGGWLAIRDQTDELLAALVDAQRDAAPTGDLLDPIDLAETEDSCAPVSFDDCYPSTATGTMLQAIAVRVEVGTERATLRAGEQAVLGGFQVDVFEAVVGELGSCIDDGDDPSGISVLAARQ